MVYCKSTNLIGSPIVDYLLVEHHHMAVSKFMSCKVNFSFVFVSISGLNFFVNETLTISLHSCFL